MSTELEKLLGEDPKEVTPSSKEPEVTPEPKEETPEEKEQTKLSNIQKAVKQEEDRLKELRKKRKAGIVDEDEPEEDLPKIDLKDPSAKAWDKRIQDTVNPALNDLEKAKDERKLFALRQFLADKPDLAKNPDKLKAMMGTYDRLKTSSELTSEGITMDLERAYAAEHAEELINSNRQRRINEARDNAIYSDPAVSRGSTIYSGSASTQTRSYTADEVAQLAKWGMTPAQHAEMVKDQQKKNV